jgi:thiosulfate/3-mercaptopyruvate sulfurtransferase
MSATGDTIFAEPRWLAEHLNDPGVRIVEVDVGRAAYEQGHIPGAILWNAYTDLHHPDYSPMGRKEFEELLRRSGLEPSDTIIFYGYAPYLGFWLMKTQGHECTRVLNGTRQGWREAGYPWTAEQQSPAPTTYALPGATSSLISLAALQRLLGAGGEGDPLILDVRSEGEFVGERFWPSGATAGAGRPGHIPGAVHLPIERLHTADGAFRDVGALRQLFQDRGVVPERGVITYCTIGARASEAATVLRYALSYPDVRVYGGSWAEWGTRAETPIER